MKNEKKNNVATIGIVASIIGLVISAFLVILSFINGASKTLGIILFCACSATLCANIANKRKNK